MGLVLSSLCLGIDLCMINLSIAPGHVHPEQGKAASTADVGCVPPRIIDYKKRKSDLRFCIAERTFREGGAFEAEILQNAYFSHLLLCFSGGC